MVNTSNELRNQVSAWLNSKNEDFQEGLALLQQSGYKPNVTTFLLRQGESAFTRSKLRNELSGYLRYFRNPSSAIHEDIPSGNIIKEVENQWRVIREAEIQEYPDIVKKAWYEYSDLYTQRSVLHKQLKEVGESNDTQSMNKRKGVKTVMEAISRRIEELWKAIDEYKRTNVLPDGSLFAETFNPEEIHLVIEKKVPELPDTAAELTALKRNLQSKLTKHSNKLLYQSTKKMDTHNPLPEGPDRIKTEKYVSELKEQIEQVNLKLAQLA